MDHMNEKKATRGDTIELMQKIRYENPEGLIEIEKGETFEVSSRDRSDKGVYIDKGIYICDTHYVITMKGDPAMKRPFQHLTNMELDTMYWETNKKFTNLFHVKEIREEAHETLQIVSEELRYRHEHNLM